MSNHILWQRREVGVVLCVLLSLFTGTTFSQDIVSLYNAVEQQLASIRASADQLQNDVNTLNADLAALGESQQQTGSFDQAMIVRISETQVKRGQDLDQLLNARDLWQKNFGVVNRTFTNLRKKFPI